MEQKVELKTTAFQENSNDKRKFQNLNSWSNRHNHKRHSMIFGTESPELLNDEHISKKIVQQLIGIIFGMIVAIVRDRFDHIFYFPDEVKQNLNQPLSGPFRSLMPD